MKPSLNRKKIFWMQSGVPPSVVAEKPAGKWKKGSWKALDDEQTLASFDVDHEEVEKLLRERDRFREEKDFEKADKIYEDLKGGFGIIVDDIKRCWRVYD